MKYLQLKYNPMFELMYVIQVVTVSHSDAKCFRTTANAYKKCEDCSSDMFDVIVCNACALQCHDGHLLSTCRKQLCRCEHKDPTKFIIRGQRGSNIRRNNVFNFALDALLSAHESEKEGYVEEPEILLKDNTVKGMFI